MSLATLHQGLERVRRYRATARIASALALSGSIVLWVLFAAFILDVALRPSWFERLIMLLMLIAAVVATSWLLVRKAIRTREDPVSLALIVERQQSLTTDLVAAIQFADTGRQQHGSSDLRQAVVDITGEAARDLNYLDGFSRQEMLMRLVVFIATMIVALIPIIAFPAHTHVFVKRLTLRNVQYPTRTTVEELLSPGAQVARGRPVRFVVRVSGEPPPDGVAIVRAPALGLSTVVTLLPSETDPTIYVGELPRALDALTYTIAIGDALTEPRRIELIHLPVADLKLEVQTPAYARGRFEAAEGFDRQFIALEGSRVTPIVTCDKPLSIAAIKVAGASYLLRREGDHWMLATAGTPFESISESLRFEIDVTDVDGMKPERTIVGLVQMRPDHPPRIAAVATTQMVVPDAAPRIRYRAIDDFGLARVILHRTVVRQQAGDTPASSNFAESPMTVAHPADHPLELTDTIRVELSDLGLVKGDRVIVTVEAVDDRGGAIGRSSRSDKIVFEVTDRAGAVTALRELDDRLDERLEAILKAQPADGPQP